MEIHQKVAITMADPGIMCTMIPHTNEGKSQAHPSVKLVTKTAERDLDGDGGSHGVAHAGDKRANGPAT